MVAFVTALREAVRAAHKFAVVVWYDAVTSSGDLAHQNALTPLNSKFFDAADAIFLNYFWDPPLLDSSAAVAGKRAHDVFVGVDVWGRRSWGGGGFNTAAVLNFFKYFF